MAINILPSQKSFGQSLGTSLGEGLASLADMKLSRLLESQEKQKFKQGLLSSGLDPQFISLLSSLPNATRDKVLGAYATGGGFNSLLGGGNEQQGPLQALQGMNQQQQQPQEQQQQPQEQQFNPLSLLNTGYNNLQSSLGMQQNPVLGNQPSFNQRSAQPTLQSQPLQGMNEQQQQQQLQQSPTKKSTADIIAEGLKTPAERSAEKKLDFAKEQAAKRDVTENQKRVERANKPFKDSIDKNRPVYEKQLNTVDEYLRLLDSKKINSPYEIRLLPVEQLSPETRQLMALGDQLAGGEATAIPGVVSVGRIRFMRELKPNPSMPLESQRYLANKLKGETVNNLQRIKVTDDLISKNNDTEPANLSGKVSQELAKRDKLETNFEKLTSDKKGSFLIEHPELFPSETEFTDNNEIVYVRNPEDNSWIKKG